MNRLTELVPFFGRHRVQLASGMASTLGEVILVLAVPIIIGRGVDALRGGFSANQLLRYSAVLVGVTLLQGLFSFLKRRILVTMSRDIEFEIRDRYFAHLERMSQAFFHGYHTGDLMARGTNDLQAVRMLCGPAIMYSTNTLFTAVGALYFMIRIDPWLTALALCALPLVAYVTKVFGQRIHHLFERVQEQFATLSTNVQEHLSGVRVIRAYAQETSSAALFEDLNHEYVDRSRHLIRWTAAFHPLLQGLIGIGFVAVLWYGGGLVTAGTITVGQFVTFTFFLGRLVWPMIAIGWVINLAQRGSASWNRILQVLESEPDIADIEDCLQGPVRGDVEIRDLTFSYGAQGQPALEEITLAAPAGATVAIVGRTGAGKSTLLSLMCRLWDPPEGSLLIDETDIRRFCLAGLRQSVAVVPQESFLFSATLAENIAFGKPSASLDEIHRVAAIAGLEEDLELLPQGLETRVGERGVTLSGGQKQRVALARALLRDPRVLLLDDCLSAVDTRTEEHILGRLQQEFEGRTVFLVSHRISTVKRADLIVVLDRGRIVERGSHQGLLEAGGIYADLDRRQQLEDELAAV